MKWAVRTVRTCTLSLSGSGTALLPWRQVGLWPEIVMGLIVNEDLRAALDYFACMAEDDGSFSPALIHDLPVGGLLELAVRTVGFAAETADRDKLGAVGYQSELSSRLRHPSGDVPSRGSEAVASLRTRPTMTDGLLREVADIVQSDTHGAPREAIRARMHVSLRTASRWMAEARKRGFLPSKGQS